MLKTIFYNTFIEVERERENYTTSNKSVDLKVFAIGVLVAFSLSMIYYLGKFEFLKNWLLTIGATDSANHLNTLVNGKTTSNIGDLTYWVIILCSFYFVIPVIVIKLFFKENLSDYGLRWQGAFKDYHLYVIMLLIMIPLVLYFSSTKSFQARYPFLNISSNAFNAADFIQWELLYCAQFFALEFFFRGFLLHGLKKRMGIYSVIVMTIPYCMIHFGKPLPETLAAIIAGIVLGFLSLKSNSILLGCLIHMSVGLSMDLASLWQKGILF